MSDVGWKMRKGTAEFAELDQLCQRLNVAHSAAYRIAVEWQAAQLGQELRGATAYVCSYVPILPGQVSVRISRPDKWDREHKDAKSYRSASRAAFARWVAAGAPLPADQPIRLVQEKRPPIRSLVVVSSGNPRRRRLRDDDRDGSCAPRRGFVAECEAQSIWPLGHRVQPGSITGRPYVVTQ